MRRSRCNGPEGLTRWRLLVLGGVLLNGMLGGCQRALFPEDSTRTQFDKYDVMRNRFTPETEPDVFGNPQPALRARLSPRD